MNRCSLLAPLACVWLLACALDAPRPLVPHLEASLPEDVAPDAPRLLVASFADARSTRPREAGPRLALRPWSIARRGFRYSDERSFQGSVAAGVRADAIATLLRSGLFRAVTPSSDPQRSPSELRLEATLEEFSGWQYQASELSLLRAGFLHHKRDPAIGVVRLHYRLRELASGVLLFDERIESRLESRDSELAVAVLDALALTNERLVQALYRVLRPRARASSRPLRVRLLDACGLGGDGARRLLADTNEILVREAGLHLRADIEIWTPPHPLPDSGALLRALRELEAPPGGLVIALAGMPHSALDQLGGPRFGLATPLGEHALVACGPGEPARALTVVHEVAHLFGAVHVRDRGSIMNPVAAYDARMLDPLNRRVVRAAAGRPLGEPLPAGIARRLAELYALAASRESFAPGDLGAVQAALERQR